METSRQELMELAKKFIGYYEDFEEVIIPDLKSFIGVCEKRSLKIKLNNLLVRCEKLYKDLKEIYKTKSWVPLEELEEQVLGFEKHLNTIQKEYMILTRNNLDDNDDEILKTEL